MRKNIGPTNLAACCLETTTGRSFSQTSTTASVIVSSMRMKGVSTLLCSIRSNLLDYIQIYDEIIMKRTLSLTPCILGEFLLFPRVKWNSGDSLLNTVQWGAGYGLADHHSLNHLQFRHHRLIQQINRLLEPLILYKCSIRPFCGLY